MTVQGCVSSLATVGLSSVLKHLKLLYLSVQEVASSQKRRGSFELRASEYTRSHRIKETILFSKKKVIEKGGGRGECAPIQDCTLLLLRVWERLSRPASTPSEIELEVQNTLKERRMHPPSAQVHRTGS